MEPERFAFSTPLEIEFDGQYQVVSVGSNFVGSYDPDNGREIWRVGFSRRWSVIPRPIYSDGLVYVTTGFEGPASLLARETCIGANGWAEPIRPRCCTLVDASTVRVRMASASCFVQHKNLRSCPETTLKNAHSPRLRQPTRRCSSARKHNCTESKTASERSYYHENRTTFQS